MPHWDLGHWWGELRWRLHILNGLEQVVDRMGGVPTAHIDPDHVNAILSLLTAAGSTIVPWPRAVPAQN